MGISAFIPNELKTTEVDVASPFGDRCAGFSIFCDASDGYVIHVEIDARAILVGYIPMATKN